MRFSIVSPSFNQAPFLETCLQSVLGQEGVDCEYLVIDGGSTDGSVDVIRRRADKLAFWRSHPDQGQADAVQEGFRRSSGEILGWLNSDDMYLPWTLQTVADVFAAFPQVDWLTSKFSLTMDEAGVLVGTREVEGYNPEAFYRGRNTQINPRFHTCYIQQELTFWRRSLWEKAGARMDTAFRGAGDFELWSCFFRYAELYAVAVPLAGFRYQPGSFTSNRMSAYLAECRSILNRSGFRDPSPAECSARQALRLLPPRLRRIPGVAYQAPIVYHGGRKGSWYLAREWFV